VSQAWRVLSWSGLPAVVAFPEDFRHKGFQSGIDADLFPVKLALFAGQLPR